jgi:DNA-binding IclR family transcriptional regulator
VDRALGLLRLVAAAPPEGSRMSDLAEACGLDRATVHRLLSSLAGNGLVNQDAVSKRYTLGLEFFALAAAASNRHDLSQVARGSLLTIAEQTGDTATLCLRSGANLICIDVELGRFPIKALPMDIGSRRPLGAGASGIAMLAALPDFEVEQVLHKVSKRLAKVPGQDASQVAQAIAECRIAGYALAADEPLGRIIGMAVTLNNRRGRPEGTLSINGIPERFTPERLPMLVGALQHQIKAISHAMDGLPDRARHRALWSRASSG